ncbi:hypothetical protein [Halomonas sp. GD1P12]|uniref:hypothetical protein n=1 Tax=Halomonas sp. GD1P12 TaxID=2982691 RepID=UPI0021E47F84|nr:hypothetical protein [Halomonas sp. GD1P12]UYG00653.1 hypothetical protein OCT39_03600 [Halomonas sp. GD1P12]
MNHEPRPLSALERTHARTAYLRLTLFKWLLVVFASLILMLGIILPVAFVIDDTRAHLALIIFMGLLDLLVVALALFIMAHGLGRAATLRPTTAQLRGRLIEKTHTASTGNGGGRYTVYTYFIDDQQIVWPAGAERLYKPLVGQTITLTVAMIDMRSRAGLKALLEGIGIEALKKQPAAVGVVLACPPVIDVHGTLTRYGRYYLLRYQLKTAAAIGLFVALFLLPSLYPATTDWLVGRSHVTMLAIILGWAIGSVVVTYLIARGYQGLRKWLNPAYDDTPHEERLKG